MPKRIAYKGGNPYYFRRVPKRYASVDARVFVWIAIGGASTKAAAEAKAAALNAEQEQLWEALLAGHGDDAKRHRAALDEIARSHGFKLTPASELAQGDLDEIVRRLDYIEARGLGGQQPVVQALIGAEEGPPPFTLSEVLPFFYEHKRDQLTKKSPDQLRRYRNPRERVMRILMSIVGDIDVAALDRTQMLAYRMTLQDRILSGEILAETANKDFYYLRGVLKAVSKARAAPPPPLDDLNFPTDLANRRAPYPAEFIRDRLLAPGALDGMNRPARNVVRAMINTGMRPSEIVNIEPGNIALDAEIPHARVRAMPGRALKTPTSGRDIPLVGVSLEAFTEQREGWPEYRDREASLSGAVNKFLLENGLRPEPRQSLYSLRHSFEDRLIAVGADERMRAELMGHAYERPKYGDGPAMEMKREFLSRMAI